MEIIKYKLFLKQTKYSSFHINWPMCDRTGETSVINCLLPKINQKFKNTFTMNLVATNDSS